MSDENNEQIYPSYFKFWLLIIATLLFEKLMSVNFFTELLQKVIK